MLLEMNMLLMEELLALFFFSSTAYLKFYVKQRFYWPIITTSVIIDHCHFNKQLSTFFLRNLPKDKTHQATKPASLHLS